MQFCSFYFFFSSAVKCLPRFARALDALAENGTAFPDNVVEAQADRHSVCARISIAFPEREPGDGDGLPESSVLDFHGLYQNDQPIIDDEIMRGWEYLRPPCSYRCRLVGFDTQESPASRGMPIDDVRQPFWREGRQLLVDLLGDLRNGEDPANLTILADCYGMDLFQRILLDIRGASTVVQLRHHDPQARAPSMRRFEVAERFLASGYAHPTYCSYVSESLLGAFNRARERRVGAFAQERTEFVHPAECRRNRYLACNRSRQRPKPRYNE